MTKPTCDCKTAMAQLWDFLDEELTEERLEMVRDHLASCSHCHPHLQFAEGFLAALGKCRHGGPMPEGARAKVLASLREQGLL